MSIVRRGKDSEVYIYECAMEDRLLFHCQICSLAPQYGDTFLKSRFGVMWHAFRHKIAGHRIPLRQTLSAVWE